MPVVLDRVFDPPRHRLPLWSARLAGPSRRLAHANLVRGEIVDWYPYPFADGSELGYSGVLGRSAVLTLGFALGAAALLWLGNLRAR